MMGFVQLDWRTQVKASEIERIVYREEDQSHVVYLKDGEYGRKLSANAHGHLTKHPVQLLHADAGTKLCQWDLDGPEPQIWYEPVIAWALCIDGEIRPATPCGVDDGIWHSDTVSYVKMPDGYIKAAGPNPDIGSFDDEAALLKHLLDERRIRAEHRAAAALLADNASGAAAAPEGSALC
jgi:hypothetical protein